MMHICIFARVTFSILVVASQMIDLQKSQIYHVVEAKFDEKQNKPLDEWILTEELSKVDHILQTNEQQGPQSRLESTALESARNEQGNQLSMKNIQSMASGNVAKAGDYEPSSCQLTKVVMVLQRPGCQSKAISTHACSGTCPSYVQVSRLQEWQHERSCSCCQQTAIQEDTFVLDCPGLTPPYREVKTYAPVNCICRSCSDVSRDNIRPQELVEALEGQSSPTIYQ